MIYIMRGERGVTLTLLVIATIIAILICTIIYCIFFSQNGIVTMLGKTKTVIENSYKEEAETLSQMEDYIDSYMPDDKLYLSYNGD